MNENEVVQAVETAVVKEGFLDKSKRVVKDYGPIGVVAVVFLIIGMLIAKPVEKLKNWLKGKFTKKEPAQTTAAPAQATTEAAQAPATKTKVEETKETDK